MTLSHIQRQIKKLVIRSRQSEHSASKNNPVGPISISETQAAELFFSSMTQRVFEEWPDVIFELRKTFGPECILDQLDEEQAKLELLLAAMALDLLALKNLFPEEQAQRLFERCIESTPSAFRSIA